MLGEHTGAASVYVGTTRGRRTKTAHLIAANLTESRDQWIAVFARDRADLGPAHAAELAAREAARYATSLAQTSAELSQSATSLHRSRSRDAGPRIRR